MLAIGGALLVKRIQLRLDGSVVVKSDNAVYETEVMPADQTSTLKVLGEVIWQAGPVRSQEPSKRLTTMPLFVRNPMSKSPKTNFLSGTYDQPVFAVIFRKTRFFSTIIPRCPRSSRIVPDVQNDVSRNSEERHQIARACEGRASPADHQADFWFHQSPLSGPGEERDAL
ncbi:MAG: hypothetical protein INF75_11415 [Roseomonas sp.]|nr:hypothetical protein [Roseomonas sp.]MCA3331426.1 hypothetical protein [Roseomonas sp.]MCA3335505.1 hypothetical protein [Roseomonas sp.]MCA3348312.1 hypothetical protein [Roseomonas sp.]MCA3355695.1 hypothetical protein [Roseomonas sp.]